MDGNALVNMLKDRRILVIILAVIVIIAAVGAYMLLKDDGGNPGQPSNGLIVDNERTISEDTVVEGTLQITENGKLTITNGAEIRMLGADAKVDVKGTLDATDGKITFVKQEDDGSYTPVYENGEGETRSVTSTGMFVLTADNFASQDFLGNITGIMNFANGAIYIDSGNVVLTSVASAASANSDVEVFGTISESSDVTINGSEVLTIMDGANVSLGTITLSGTTDGTPEVDVSGTLTASISATDVGGVRLDAVSGITVNIEATGTGDSSVSKLTVDGTVSGALTVTNGEVEVGSLTVNGSGNTLGVAEGAILHLGAGSVINAGSSADGETAAISVAGNLVLDGGNIRSAESTKALVDVSGTVDVLENATVDGTIVLTGVIAIDENPTDFSKEATNNVTFNASVKLQADSYIKVYGNCSFSPNSSTGNIVNTAFHVNDMTYMTVYAIAGDVTISTVLKDETFMNGETIDATMSDCKNWNQDPGYLGDFVADNKNIGESGYTVVHHQIETVEITFTVPSGVTVEFDDVKIDTDNTTRLLVVGHEYDVSINGGTAKYGDISVEDKFTPVKDVTKFVVTANSV